MTVTQQVEVGQVVEGKVTKILPYGAVVDIAEGVSGLVHISEIAEEYVRDVSQHLRLGDVVRAKVTGMKEPGKYQLSIKALSAPAPRSGGPSSSLEAKISKFMKESQQRQADLKRAREGKRGRRR